MARGLVAGAFVLLGLFPAVVGYVELFDAMGWYYDGDASTILVPLGVVVIALAIGPWLAVGDDSTPKLGNWDIQSAAFAWFAAALLMLPFIKFSAVSPYVMIVAVGGLVVFVTALGHLILRPSPKSDAESFFRQRFRWIVGYLAALGLLIWYIGQVPDISSEPFAFAGQQAPTHAYHLLGLAWSILLAGLLCWLVSDRR